VPPLTGRARSRTSRPGAGRWARLRGSLSAEEWRRIGGMVAVVAGLHALGFFLLFAVVVPQHLDLGGSAGAFGVGLGITAYTLGLRHAFDADHIGAIDNTTRKLMADGQRPLAVGFFFALGHSTIVFALATLFAVGIRGLGGAVGDESSTVHQVTGLIGPSVSGLFLMLIGILNLVVLISVLGIFRRMRSGHYAEAELEQQLDNRGLMNRFYGRATRSITRSWQMYPLGALFGLGFDTATEIALLAVAGSAAIGGLPWYAILCLPILFAAGMSLLDSIDGAFMNFAYGWAFSRPVRKVFYNLTVTALSVLVALAIGSIELVAVISERLGLTGFPFGDIAALDLNRVGYAIAAIFVITWLIALATWRFGRIEERWSADLRDRG